MIEVPDDLRRTIASWAGEPGARWLADLPRLVAECAELWGLTVGAPYQPSGYTSLAAPATRADGTPCVLKVRCPDEDWGQPEGAALRHYGGVAAVTLLAEDARLDALLLERCTPGTSLLTEPDDVAARVVAETVRELWAPPAEGHPFRPLSRGAEPWAASVRGSTRIDPRLRDETLELLAWLVATEPEPVVLHCDLHPGNVLRAERRPWLAIDPKPAVGDPAYDLAPVIRDRATPELARRRYAIACEVTGLDPARVRGWALVQAVEGAAWAYDAGDTAEGDAFSRAAESIAPLPSVP